MSVRIVNTLTGDTDADRRTKDATVRNGEAMAEHLGRAYSAPARSDLGILWGGNGGDTDGYPWRSRRVLAVGFVKDGFGDTFTRRTKSGQPSHEGHTEF